MRHLARWRAAMLLLSVLCASCDKSSPKNDDRAPSPPEVASAPAPTASAGVPEGKTTAAPIESAAPAEGASSIAGTWEGKYTAKRGEVEMPPKVTDKVRAADDGKTATGPGTLTLTVEPAGDVKGKNEGALGAAMLSGKTEGDDVRCTFFPDDPLAKNAMFGIFSGKRDGDRIVGKIRVAGPDAALVREADVELRKK
jgi:hypothetical protein